MKQSFGILFAALLLASPVVAQDIGSQITDQLREQGYGSVQVTKTWLGRLRIEASSADQRREIIVNPRTGEILRDFLSKPNRSEPQGVQILDRPAPRPAPSGGERPAPRDGSDQGGKPSGSGSDGGRGPGGGSGSNGPSR